MTYIEIFLFHLLILYLLLKKLNNINIMLFFKAINLNTRQIKKYIVI